MPSSPFVLLTFPPRAGVLFKETQKKKENWDDQTSLETHRHKYTRTRKSASSFRSVHISFPPIQKIMNVQRIINENNNNNSNIFYSLLGGGENHVSNKNKSNSSRARGVLGNITNNNNSRSNNFATTAGKKKTTNKNFDSNSIECLQRDVERLARQECHEFEAIGRNSTTNSNNNNNNEDRIILSKIMEELIVEYSERELPHSYYYKTLREASNRAGNERDDLCRFSF